MNSVSRSALFLIVSIVFIVVSMPLMAEDSPDDLYDRAQNAYLEFKTDDAAELLHKVLKKAPNHERARALLAEMGREVPDVEDLQTGKTKADTASDKVEKTSDTRPEETRDEKAQKSGDQQSGDPTTDTETVESTDAGGEPANVDQSNEDTTAQREVSPDTDGDSREGEADRSLVVPEETSRTTSKSMTVSTGPSSDTIGTRSEDQLIAPIIEVESDTTRQGKTSDDKTGTVPTLRTGNEGESDEPLLTPEDVDPSDTETEEAYRSNLNTASHGELSDVFDDELANLIIDQRKANGYYLSWSDFEQRIDINDGQFQTLQDEFTLAIPVVNVNTASTQELARLPYITTSVAKNIVNFRFTYGNYRSVDELVDVPGVEESALNSVKSFLEAR